MGRTLPTATMLLHEEEREFASFRNALSHTDQRIVDQLFDSAQKHTAAVSYAAHPLPTMVFYMAMLVEQQKQIRRLQAQVEMLQNPLLSRAAGKNIKEGVDY